MNKMYYQHFPELGFASDFRLVGFPDDYLNQNQEIINSAHEYMHELESGAIANPDEGRMVGHYWLRKPELSPTPEIAEDIRTTLKQVKQCARRVKDGELSSPQGHFTDLLVIGIGGSALGPQFVGKALAKSTGDDLKAHFFDNTDPDGIDFILSQIGRICPLLWCWSFRSLEALQKPATA